MVTTLDPPCRLHLIKGSFKNNEKMSINHYIARHTSNSHYCNVPGCKDPCIKSSENKFSTGQMHIKRYHLELVHIDIEKGTSSG